MYPLKFSYIVDENGHVLSVHPDISCYKFGLKEFKFDENKQTLTIIQESVNGVGLGGWNEEK